jgi:SpoVK/Ycf46/Vps4 family AAA+-type ATPase
MKDRVIIESELEYNDESVRSNETNKNHHIPYPFVRVFSFSQKEYFFVDVNNLEDYKYDNEAINRVFLPEKIRHLLNSIFTAPIDSLVGDIIDYKHGGMIILAYGNPGIGKTSTAEVYSEIQQIPLYTIDIAELGTSADRIEKNLSTIFKRVENWNAIVLFDEIDVFLAKREKNDLNRTAIVGVFLRLMDYFKGVMFLTSNRPEVLDYAISSRITLKIKYPDLDENTRYKIWKEKLNRAAINFKGDLTKVSQIELNGREIRNMIRLAKILHPSEITDNQLIDLIKMTSLELNS